MTNAKSLMPICKKMRWGAPLAVAAGLAWDWFHHYQFRSLICLAQTAKTEPGHLWLISATGKIVCFAGSWNHESEIRSRCISSLIFP